MKIAKINFAVLICAFCLCFTSCSKKTSEYKYSSKKGNWQSSERYIVTDCSNDYLLYDKQTGETFPLVRDAFAQSSVKYVNVCGEKVYYIESYGDNGSWRINMIDLDTFSTSTIFDNDNSESVFLGLNYKQTNLDSFLKNVVSGCMVTDDYIFLETGLKGLLRINRVSGREKMVLRDMSSNGFCCDGENIYYITDEMRPKSYSIRSEEEKILTDDLLVRNLCLMSEGRLIFQEYGGELYAFDTLDCKVRSLNVTAENFTANSENIFFTTSDGIYKMKLDGKPTLLCEGEFAEINALNDNEYIFFVENDDQIKRGIINISAQ